MVDNNTITYNFMYNATAKLDETPAIIRALDEAILVYTSNNSAASIKMRTKPYPQLRPSGFKSSVVAESGRLFLVCPAMFNFILFAYQVHFLFSLLWLDPIT